MARRILKKDASWSGRAWWKGFRKRWRGIVNLRIAKRSSEARNSPQLKETVEEFVGFYGDLVRNLNLSPDFIINIDETMADPKDRPATSKRVGRVGKQELHITSHPTSGCRSLLICAAASGNVWMSLKIFPAKGVDSKGLQREIEVEDAPYLLRNRWNKYYTHSGKGNMSKELWGETLLTLAKVLDETRGDRPVLILCDHPKVHVNIPVMEELLKRDIYILFFPHNSSHILQPLDGAPFAHYKQLVRELDIRDRVRTILETGEPSSNLLSIEDAENKAFQPDIIKAGFRERGIWPFEPEVIRGTLQKILDGSPHPQDTEKLRSATEISQILVDISSSGSRMNNKKLRSPAKEGQIMLGEELIRRTRRLEQEQIALREQKLRDQAEKLLKRNEKQQALELKKKERILKRQREASGDNDSQPPNKIPRATNEKCSSCTVGHRSTYPWWLCQYCKTYRLCSPCMKTSEKQTSHEKECEKGQT